MMRRIEAHYPAEELTTWYLVSMEWLQAWKKWLRAEGPRPGAIDNSSLDLTNPKPGVTERGISMAAWHYLQKTYGGGPVVRMLNPNWAAMEVPRPLVEKHDSKHACGCVTCLGRKAARIVLGEPLDGQLSRDARELGAVFSAEIRNDALVVTLIDHERLPELRAKLAAQQGVSKVIAKVAKEDPALGAALTSRPWDMVTILRGSQRESSVDSRMSVIIGAANSVVDDENAENNRDLANVLRRVRARLSPSDASPPLTLAQPLSIDDMEL